VHVKTSPPPQATVQDCQAAVIRPDVGCHGQDLLRAGISQPDDVRICVAAGFWRGQVAVQVSSGSMIRHVPGWCRSLPGGYCESDKHNGVRRPNDGRMLHESFPVNPFVIFQPVRYFS